MIAFLRFILITFLVFTILGYVFRFLIKIYLTRLARKMSNQQQDRGQKVGETYIRETKTKEKVVNPSVGDYVDYEEIKPKE